MVEFLRSEKQFLAILAIWVVAGMIFAPLAWVVVPIMLFLMQRKQMYMEMLLGFFVVLILSDSRQYAFHFAIDLKDIYLLLLALFCFTDRNAFSPPATVVKNWAPFLVIAVLFIIFSDVLLKTAQKTLSYGLMLFVVPNFLVFAWKAEGRDALRKFIWTGVLMLLLGFALRFIVPSFVTLAGRFSGMLGNPNGLGLFCVVFFILFVIAGDAFKGLFTRRETIFVIGAILLSTLLSGSRNAVFTIAIFLLFRYFYRISPFVGIFVFLLSVLIYQLLLANLEGIIIALDLQEYFRIETLQNASGRLIAWDFGWQKISENPIIGHGIGYTDNLYRVNYALLSVQGHQGNAHNSYITFWIDTGLFGLLAYLIPFVRSFVIGSRRVRSAIPAMFAIMFSAFFESWLTASLNPFTIQCFIVITLLSDPAFQEERVDAPEDETVDEELATDPDLIGS